MSQGILLLDNSCYAKLVRPPAMARLKANMRVADLKPGASEVNLLEATATTSPAVEAQLIAAIREFAGTWPLLEWPFVLLRRLGHALLDGEPQLFTGESGKEWYLDDPKARDALRAEVREFNERLERSFAQMHARARPRTQKRLKAQGIRRDLEDLPMFLDDEWPGTDLFHDFAAATWKTLELPGELPLDRIRAVPAWRLLLDIEGAAVYARAIVHEQPRAVHRADLIQLVYLGASGRRILATGDQPFLDVASRIVTQRYPGARVIHIDRLLE